MTIYTDFYTNQKKTDLFFHDAGTFHFGRPHKKTICQKIKPESRYRHLIKLKKRSFSYGRIMFQYSVTLLFSFCHYYFKNQFDLLSKIFILLCKCWNDSALVTNMLNSK